MRIALRRLVGWSLGVATAAAIGAVALDRLDHAYPPPLDPPAQSREVIDREGRLLRAYAAPDGRWRMAVALDAVDPALLRMLVAYEDRRFWDHQGVDPLAALRALGQIVRHGRIVSGGSTITMQLARLLEPRTERSFAAKLRQALRALQIERRLSKREILERYLTLAPYGGNLEGVRSATHAWFGKDARHVSVAEAALLVALPQAPERRRPDRDARAATAARDRVLARMAQAGVIAPRDVENALRFPVAPRRLALPSLAPHLADRIMAGDPKAMRRMVTIDRDVQLGLEAVAAEAVGRLPAATSVAIVAADARTGEVLASVGSADFFSTARRGWIDMTGVPRSPGSTLKPFIYGLAFEEGLIAQETVIEDRPASFGVYRPRNFDLGYQGDVSIRTALQLSLNVPAIRLLDAVGPQRLASRLRDAGVTLSLPPGEAPGLAIGLGGAGVSLRDLVELYTGLANRGTAATLREVSEAPQEARRLLDDRAAWQVNDILLGVMPPPEAPRRAIAYKTGTSYGYRDAWAIGYDGRHVIGIWAGRADGGAVPGLSGYVSSAPILFEAFARSGLAHAPLPPAPAGALRQIAGELPVTQRRFASLPGQAVSSEPPPVIVFPPDGARIEQARLADGAVLPLALKLQGGRAPFRWLANGRLLPQPGRRRNTDWTPDGEGFATLTVIDSAGRAASVQVFVE